MVTRPPRVFPTALEAADRHLTLTGLRELVDAADPDAVLIDGAGHNAHWEAPEEVWRLLGPG
jgi:pimeloyl-ACP methyl ester carboxylesterase